MFHTDARKLILAPMILAAALTSAYADSNLFFYNADTGSGAITTFSRTQPPTTISGQEFSSGWNIVSTGLNLDEFFYNGQSGLAVEASSNQNGVMSDDNSYNFSNGWTQIVDVNPAPGEQGDSRPTLLFYNRATGIGVSGVLDYSGQFSQYPSVYHFSAGWTNIISTDQGMLLFYNAANGSGAVGYLHGVPDPNCQDTFGCGPIDKTFVQKASYIPGSFTAGWTSVVETHNGILFYRSSDGILVMTDVNSKTGAVSTRSNSLAHLATGWTSIAADPSNILFYNKNTGDGAIGHIVTRSPQIIATMIGKLSMDQSLPGLFSTGWTSVTPVVLHEPPPVVK